MAAADIETHCHGSGPLVYLIGGGPAFTTWNLQPIQQRLGEHYRVCRWDMRGVGDNAELAFNPQHSALAQWLGDMAEVLPAQPGAHRAQAVQPPGVLAENSYDSLSGGQPFIVMM